MEGANDIAELFSKDQLEELAAPEFEKHGVNEFHATVDGQLFIKENFARMHAGPKGTVYHLVKPGSEAPATDKGDRLSVPKLTAAIATIENIEELQAMLEAEKAHAEPRSTAIAAIEKRIQTLTA